VDSTVMNALDRSLLLLGEWVAGAPTEIANALGSARVRIAIADELADDPATQTATTTLVNLLIRTFIHVEIDVRHAPVVTPLLPEASSFGAGIARLTADAFPSGPRRVRPRVDVEVLIGPRPASSSPERWIWLTADAWLAGYASEPEPWRPAGPLEALAAAGLAAGEIVRFALRHLPPASSTAADWLARIERAQHRLLPVPPGPIDLGALDIISAGAITHSLLFAIVARGAVEGDLRIFDDGSYEPSNSNRYMLLRQRDLGALKVEHLAALRIPDIRITPVPERFGNQHQQNLRRRAVVGADDIAVRHVVQAGAPAWLGIGATSHDEVRVTEHPMSEPCAGCAHPHVGDADDRPIPTIAPVTFWAGLQLALHLLADAANDAAPEQRRYETYWPLRPGTAVIGPLQWHPGCPVDASHRLRAAVATRS
jgi:hypothetical protein